MTIFTSVLVALSMLTAPNMAAQSRQSSTSRSSTTSRQSGTTTSQSGTTSRQSGTTTRQSSGSTTSRQSGTTTSQSGTTSRQSGTTTRQSSGSTTSRQSGTTTRQTSGSTTTRQSSGSSSTATSRQSGTTVSRQSSGSTGSSSSRSSSGSVSRSSTVNSNSSSGDIGSNLRSTNVSRGGLISATSKEEPSTVSQPKENYRDAGYNYRYNDDMRVDDNHNLYRVPPHQRAPMAWDRPGNFWGDHPHYYGYRINSLPPQYRRISHWGIDYYYHNGIYYRPYGGMYVVCRPPFGTPLERAIDRAILNVIRFAYYCDTYRTFSRTFDYYNTIARQNMIIAQQNARIAQLNSSYAMNSKRALSAYELAEQLGLVQSYANAGAEYFYQDGVFYSISASGAYSTIIPPAGALVTSLPDDYEVIVMNGIEYYMVDNTVYRTTLFDGQPYLEVLGQMYGSLYSQYRVY